MKSKFRMLLSAITFFAGLALLFSALALPLRLAAQEKQAHNDNEQHQDGPLAAEGHGLLPEPSVAADATLDGVPPAHPFVSDPSGGFSRVLFQSSDDPNFNVTIRDYSFPPDKQARSVTLPAGALLQLHSDVAAVSVAKQPVEAAAGARIAVPAGAPVEVTNGGDSAVVVRVYLFQAK